MLTHLQYGGGELGVEVPSDDVTGGPTTVRGRIVLDPDSVALHTAYGGLVRKGGSWPVSSER